MSSPEAARGARPGPWLARPDGPAPRPTGARAPAGRPPRRAVLAGLLLLGGLGGCGFAPALRPGARGRVAVEAPATRAGVVLARRLEDRLGAPAPRAPWRLVVALAVEPEAAAVSDAQVVTRVRLEGVAEYAVAEAATGAERLRGRAEAFASYDATGTTVALDASARDAEDRLVAILADRIAARLLAAGLG